MSDDNDYQRPRRPSPETIAYLKSLPLDLAAAKDEFKLQSEEGGDFSPILAASLAAIEEIRHEVASLAGDEDAAQLVELLAHITLPHSETAGRILLSGLTGYHLHLATHRYGSHVVQTILELAVSGSAKDTVDHEEAPDLETSDLPSLQELILNMVEELTPTANQLAVHLCGSHVMRSLVCILGGVQIKVQDQYGGKAGPRRGREKSKKKKKKKKAPAMDDGAQRNAGAAMELDYQTSAAAVSLLGHKEGSKFRLSMPTDTFQSFLQALWGSQQQGELQQMACHPSAGPLLILSLRVLTFTFLSDKTPWLTDAATSDAEKQTLKRDVMKLGLVKPEPQFEIDSPAHEFCKQLLMMEGDDESKVGEVIYGLSGEPRGSHVLETLLRIAPDSVYQFILEKGDFVTSLQEYAEHDVSNFVVQALLTTARSKEQAEVLLNVIAEKLISSGYVLDAKNRRAGIFWRATELAAKFQVQQEPLLKALRMGMGASSATSKEDAPVEDPEEGTKMKKVLPKVPSVALQDCVAPLLNIKAPVKDGDRVTLGVEGTRAVYHMLQFAPRLCGGILDGITETLSAEELELLAKDGLGSRCIWDGILDGPKKEKAFQKADRNLLAKLKGRWVALASDRVGHHSVMKLFTNLNMEDKAVLTSELAQGSNRLGGSTMGRTVMEACAVKAFLDGEQMWNDAVRKLQKDDTWLDDLLEPKEEKKKRKRKQNPEKETKKPKPSTLDSIVATISNAVKN